MLSTLAVYAGVIGLWVFLCWLLYAFKDAAMGDEAKPRRKPYNKESV